VFLSSACWCWCGAVGLLSKQLRLRLRQRPLGPHWAKTGRRHLVPSRATLRTWLLISSWSRPTASACKCTLHFHHVSPPICVETFWDHDIENERPFKRHQAPYRGAQVRARIPDPRAPRALAYLILWQCRMNHAIAPHSGIFKVFLCKHVVLQGKDSAFSRGRGLHTAAQTFAIVGWYPFPLLQSLSPTHGFPLIWNLRR
jgi:hypothetical protein